MRDLSVPENVSSAAISGYICLGAEHQFLCVDSENPIQSEDLPSNETIDPAILNNHAFPDGGQVEATENITGIAECPGRDPSECSCFPNQDPSLQCRHNAERTESSGHQLVLERDGQKMVLVGPLKGLAVTSAFPFLPFALNSRPFQWRIGYSSCPDCLRVLYHTAFLRVPTQIPPLYQDASQAKMWTRHMTVTTRLKHRPS